jgi:hypothetical protein
MTRWMRIACCIPKDRNPQSECVILIAFPRRQWLRERASLLRYTFIAPLVKRCKSIMRVICRGKRLIEISISPFHYYYYYYYFYYHYCSVGVVWLWLRLSGLIYIFPVSSMILEPTYHPVKVLIILGTRPRLPIVIFIVSGQALYDLDTSLQHEWKCVLPCRIRGVCFANAFLFCVTCRFCGRVSVVKFTERQTLHWSVIKDFSMYIIN